jgi:diadenosine tetraphosphatase ApaH/serine/threonine PP2A family protein phosphatase
LVLTDGISACTGNYFEVTGVVKRAIVSDVHGNLEALEAVLNDIAALDIKSIYCLGDIVGYGPNPRECVDRVMGFDLCVLGNHDQGALFDPEGFSSGAERAIFWTREQLECDSDHEGSAQRRWKFLCELPRQVREGSMLFVHGSARNPLNEYVFPEDIYNPRKLSRIFSFIEGACFQGHTHVPGVFTPDCRFLIPAETGNQFVLNGSRAMINVGSVGQPRDGNPMASYVVLDGNLITFRRVAYDVDSTVRKIHAIPELDDFLGDRLRDGR